MAVGSSGVYLFANGYYFAVLMKFGFNGSMMWAKWINFFASFIAVDGSDNVYIHRRGA